MATVYSDERANDVAAPPVPNAANKAGRVLRKYFSVASTTTTTITTADTLELCKLPVGARIVGGLVLYGAMGGTATALIGVAGTTNKYLTSTSVVSAGAASFANTNALNFGDVLAAETTIILTPGGSNYASGQYIKGYVEYISAGE